MEGATIGCVRISDDALAQPHGGSLDPNWAPNFFYLILQALQCFWDLELTLFNIPKDAVFPEFFYFKHIFGFLIVNLALKWTKTINFPCVLFEPNFKILKDFSNNVFFLLDYL